MTESEDPTDQIGEGNGLTELFEAVSAMEDQCRLIKEDLQNNSMERVLIALETIRFMNNHVKERISPHGTPISNGPIVKKRVDGATLHRAIWEILNESKAPMPVREIMAQLQSRGIGVPGQGRPANIVAHLVRMKNVERVEHGKYTCARNTKRTPRQGRGR